MTSTINKRAVNNGDASRKDKNYKKPAGLKTTGLTAKNEPSTPHPLSTQVTED